MMKTIKMTRSTVCAGKDLIVDKVYELEDKNANLLIGLGKAVEIESETDIGIDTDTTIALEDMKKEELLAYAEQRGIEIPKEANTKAKIIEIINEADDKEDEE